VSIKKTDGADSLRAAECADDAGFLLGIFRGMLDGVLTYAALKRWDNLIFDPDKQNQGN
jgi:hypothetical protein